MLHQIAILALWSLLPPASGFCTRNATTTSPRTATFRATAIPTFFPTTVTFTSSFKSATGSTYRPPSPSKGVMSRHTNMAITSLLVQEWPHPENTLPFSQSIYILATTVETVTVRYYPHGITKPPHPSSSIYTTTEATSSPRSMQVFPFSLTKFPTTRTTTFTTSTSGTTFITPGPGTGDVPLPTTPPIITIKTIVTRIETITEAWASKPTPLPYTLTRTAKARVTQSQYYLAPNGQTTSSGVVYWNEHYFPNMVVYAL